MSRSVPDIEILTNNIIKFLHKDVLLGSLSDNNIEHEICFDCELWNKGFTVIKPISRTFLDILNEIEFSVCSKISDQSLNNFAFKSQLDRFVGMIWDLKNKLLAIRCISVCNDTTNIVSHLLYTLIQTLLLLITILESINGLLTYMYSNCCSSYMVIDLLMGKLINSTTDLQVLLKDWYSIVMTFLHYSTVSTKSYIPSYVPKQPIIPPPQNGQIYHACVPYPPTPCPPTPHPNNCTPYPY